MLEFPLVTVVTVCFNAESTIKETLLSVKAQDYPHIEHLIIDGCSTDKTLEIVKEFGFESTRIISEPDQGIYDAMNKGWRLGQGSIIGFLNADDYFATSDVVSHLVSMFANNMSYLWGFGITECLNLDTGTSVHVGRKPPPKIGSWQKRQLIISGCGHPTVYTKREVFEDVGGFDLQYKICADSDWVIRAWQKYPPLFFNKKMVVMILGGASSNKRVIFELFRIHQRHYKNSILNRLAFIRHMAGWYVRNHLSLSLHKPYLYIRKLILKDR